MVKPEFGQPIDAVTLQATIDFFEDNIKVLHPFMPFITEEIWQYFKERNEKEALNYFFIPCARRLGRTHFGGV